MSEDVALDSGVERLVGVDAVAAIVVVQHDRGGELLAHAEVSGLRARKGVSAAHRETGGGRRPTASRKAVLNMPVLIGLPLLSQK